MRSVAACSLIALAAGAARADIYTVDFFPSGLHIDNTIQLRIIGPTEGRITSTRLVLGFEGASGFDAADLTVLLLAPAAPDEGSEGFWFITGADLGWSGPGPHSIDLTTNILNGELFPGLWLNDIGSLNDPPAYSGTFTEDSRFEVTIEPVPAPGAAALLLGAGVLTLRRRR